MASSVIANMKTCDKRSRITVTARDDGSMDVDIQTDCDHVREYADRLRTISMEDVVSFNGSRIVDPEVRGEMSATCLCPIAVFSAAWQEMEMLSKSTCRKVHTNEIILDPDDGRGGQVEGHRQDGKRQRSRHVPPRFPSDVPDEGRAQGLHGFPEIHLHLEGQLFEEAGVSR